MNDPGYAIDVAIDLASVYLMLRGLAATLFEDPARVGRGLRNLRRWGAWWGR